MATRPQMRAALGVGGKQLLLGGYVARAAGVGGGWPPARWGGDGRYVHWWRAAAVVGRVGVSGRRLRRRAAVYVGCVVSRGVGGVARRLVLGRGAALDAGTGGGHLQAAKGCVALAVSAATTATPSAAPPPPTHVGRRRPPPAEWGRRRWPVAARLGWRPAANRLRRVGGRPGVSWATVAVSWARERWCCVAGGGPPWSRPPQPPAAPLLPRAPPLWR